MWPIIKWVLQSHCWIRCNPSWLALEENVLQTKRAVTDLSCHPPAFQHTYSSGSGVASIMCIHSLQPGSLVLGQVLHPLRHCSLFASSDIVFALSSGQGKCDMQWWCTIILKAELYNPCILGYPQSILLEILMTLSFGSLLKYHMAW